MDMTINLAKQTTTITISDDQLAHIMFCLTQIADNTDMTDKNRQDSQDLYEELTKASSSATVIN